MSNLLTNHTNLADPAAQCEVSSVSVTSFPIHMSKSAIILHCKTNIIRKKTKAYRSNIYYTFADPLQDLEQVIQTSQWSYRNLQ